MSNSPRRLSAIIGTLLLMLTGFAAANTSSRPSAQAVVAHYADIAAAVFSDAHQQALELQKTIDQFLAKPSQETLEQARNAWKQARIPYLQSEVFRFGNVVVDEWEAQVNSWPLDEGLIDYVATDYHHALGNIGGTLNIIANPTIEMGGAVLDTRELTPEVLADLNELGGSEANVATGYHAIEFLLWGQDLHGTQPGAGERPYTDYLTGEDCSHGHCQRRRDYLRAATQLLVNDLAEMKAQWAKSGGDNYRKELLALDPKHGLARIFYGMGSLSLGELAGERTKVALEANSTEDEHDCFSDNTHWSHYYDGLGIQNVYLGRYKKMDGSTLSGPAVADYVAAKAPKVDQQTRKAIAASMAALDKLVQSAEATDNPATFDMLIAEGNTAGHAVLGDIIAALVTQTQRLEEAAAAVEVNPNDLAY